MKNIKMFRLTLVVLLALFISISLFNVNVVAEENSNQNQNDNIYDVNGDNKITYMSIGDSMTNGYGMDGYYPGYDGKPEDKALTYDEATTWTSYEDHNPTGNKFGLDRAVEGTYADLFRDHLVELGYEVEWLPSAISGLRPEDLYWLLDDSGEYDGDPYTDDMWKNGYNGKSLSRFLEASYGSANPYLSVLRSSMTEVERIENYYGTGKEAVFYGSDLVDQEMALFREEYIQRIAKSDIISIHLGSHTFNTISANKVAEVLGMNGYNFFDERTTLDYILQVYPELQKLYAKYGEQIKAKLADLVGLGLDSPYFEPLFDVFAYTTLSIIYSYDKSVQLIYEINPDAQIIIMGISNFLDGLKLVDKDTNEVVLDLGGMLDYLIDIVNLHHATIADGGFKSIYVDTMSGLDQLFDKFVRAEQNEAYLSFMLKYMSDMDSNLNALLQYGVVSGGVTYVTGNEAHHFLIKYFNAQTEEEKQNAKDNIVWANPAYAAYSDIIFDSFLPQIEPIGAFLDQVRGYGVSKEYDSRILGIILQYGRDIVNKSDDELASIPAGVDAKSFMMHLNFRCLVADGIGCHTSEIGHAVLGQKLIENFDNHYTGKDHFLDTIEPLYPLLEKYGPAALQFIYNKLEAQGVFAEIDAKVQAQIDALLAFRNNVEETVLNSLVELKAYYEARLELFKEDPIAASVATVKDIQNTLVAIENAIENAKATIAEYDEEIQYIKATYEKIVYIIENTTAKDIQDKVYEVLAEIENLSNGFFEVASMATEIEKCYRQLEKAVQDLYQQGLALKADLEAHLTSLHQEACDYLTQVAAELSVQAGIAVEEAKSVLAKSKEEAVKYFNELGINIEANVNYILYQLAIDKENALNDLMALVNDVEAAINGTNDALVARLEQYSQNLANFANEIKANLKEDIENFVAKVENVYKEATTGNYVTSGDSYYVAFGDSTAAGESYADILAEKLYLNSSHYTNLALQGMRVEDLLYLLDHEVTGDEYSNANYADLREEYLAELLKADVVTLGFNGLDYTLAQLGSLVPYENDWSLYFNDQTVELIEMGLAALEKVVGEKAGLFANQIMTIAESYLYNYLGSTIAYGKVVKAINELNPDALVITVGSYNPFNDLVFDYKGVQIKVSEYLDFLFATFDGLHFASSVVEKYSITVFVNDVETQFDALVDKDSEEALYVKVVQLLLTNPDVFLPSEQGKETIASSIYAALTHSCSHVAEADDHDCTTPVVCQFCGVVLEEGAEEHTEQVIPAVPSTCTQAGSTEGVMCSVCGKVLVAPEEVAKLDHVYDNQCDNECNICGASNANLGDHVYDNRCDEDCNICGGMRRVLGHVFGDWVVVEESTKKVQGKEGRVCSECGYVEYRLLPLAEGMGTGAIIAVASGSTIGVAAAGFSVFWFGIKKRKFSDLKKIFKK